MTELWAEAGAGRDLCGGGGGAAPDQQGDFQVVAHDVTGASLGNTRWFVPGSKSDIDDFEREPFIHSVRDGQVRFHYRGAWREPSLTRGVTPADVRWMSERLARLTAAPWSDAFRAAGYNEMDARRYVVRLRQKVTEGVSVPNVS